MALIDDLVPETIPELLSYDPETGILRWKAKPSRQVSIGDIAGYINQDGYVAIKIAGKGYCAHRIAWMLTYGEFPSGYLDHINGVRHDNRIINLRVACPSQNAANGPIRSNNTTGVKGLVQAKSGNWFGRVVWKRKTYVTRTCRSRDEACLELERLRESLHGEFANHGAYPKIVEPATGLQP